MELKYGLISKERCDEIDSWEIMDPYGYGNKLSTHGNDWVYNEDETILFCHAFMPRHDDRERNNETFLYVNQCDYQFVNYDNYDIYDEEREGEMYRIETVEIYKSDFIEKSLNKKELLIILKELITKMEQHAVRSKYFKRKYEFTFYYEGEKI